MLCEFRFQGIILLFLMLLFMFACNKKKQISGKEFVEREVLVDVLVDLHLMDGITNDRKFQRRYDADSIDVLTPILDKYQITRQMFDTTMYEYSRYPELLDAGLQRCTDQAECDAG